MKTSTNRVVLKNKISLPRLFKISRECGYYWCCKDPENLDHDNTESFYSAVRNRLVIFELIAGES